ncbi:MAG: periplasmic heavy metal sensor [Thermodesulfobacteriota bacterium]
MMMKSPWLLSVSIILNLFLAGAYVVFRPLAVTDGGRQTAAPLPYEQLDLAASQKAKLEAERDQFHAQLARIDQEIRSRQVELLGLLATDTPDQEAITAVQHGILTRQGEVQQGVIVHLLAMSAVLTPEQRTRFFTLLKAEIPHHAQACPVAASQGGLPE